MEWCGCVQTWPKHMIRGVHSGQISAVGWIERKEGKEALYSLWSCPDCGGTGRAKASPAANEIALPNLQVGRPLTLNAVDPRDTEIANLRAQRLAMEKERDHWLEQCRKQTRELNKIVEQRDEARAEISDVRARWQKTIEANTALCIDLGEARATAEKLLRELNREPAVLLSESYEEP